MKNLFFCFLLVSFHFVRSQSINQLNSNGKKNGYWKVFLDKNVNPTDSANSYFYGYELYDDGKGVIVFLKIKRKSKYILKYSDTLPIKGSPKEINGVFKWYLKRGQWITLSMEEFYTKGNPQYLKSFNSSIEIGDTTVFINENIDFTKKHNNIIGTHLIQVFEMNGKISSQYWWRKGEDGWKAYPFNE